MATAAVNGRVVGVRPCEALEMIIFHLYNSGGSPKASRCMQKSKFVTIDVIASERNVTDGFGLVTRPAAMSIQY
jgi:hypothetical protein